MIDLSKIQIKEQKLGSFGDIELKAELIIDSILNISPDNLHNWPELKVLAEKELKKSIYRKIYGEILESIKELKSLIEFSTLESNENFYYIRPFQLTDSKIKSLIEKIDKFLEFSN